ncbi:MAG: DUF58 domain-containing protein [Verrucomicrobiia bacterium]
MLRLSYRFYLLAATLNYALPRRLTQGGLLVGGGMVLAGAVGSDIDQSVAFQAFALQSCLLAVALAWAPFFRGSFAVQRSLPRLASVDQPFRYRVEVRNNGRRSYRHLEMLEDLAQPLPTFDEFARMVRPTSKMRAFRLAPSTHPRIEHRPATVKTAALPALGPGAVVDAEVEVVPLRRGPLRFKGVTVARTDPLGLVRSFVRVPLPQTVLVLPKRYRVPPLDLAGTRQYQLGGVALASSVGESEEFVALRDYRPGDPFRRIHWRSWARAGHPIVKEHQDEFLARHGLVLDTFVTPAQDEVFEEAVSVAASFACTLETQESLLDLLFAGSQAFCFTAGRSLGQPEQVLEVLAGLRPADGTDFEGLRNLVLRHAPRMAACVCVFLKWDEPRRELVRRLRMLGMPVLTLIIADTATERAFAETASLIDSADVRVLKAGRIAEGLMALEGCRA